MKKLFTLLFVLSWTGILIAQTDTTKAEPENVDLPVFNLSIDDFGDGMDASQDISGLLQSSRDIFVSTAGYTFGPARYRIRGYDSDQTAVLMNGVPMNDMESGWAYWGSWGGLNDALRNQEIQTGIVASDNHFGGLGGVTNMHVRASQYSKGVKLTYSLSNRSYANRLMFIASTGLMENGWAITASGSRRWAQEGYQEGTFYDAWAYFISAEKKLNNKHSIGLVALGAPSKRGRASAVLQEAYDLTNNNYYNPNWGYQNGEKRNARVGNYHQPMFILSHYFDISDKTFLQTNLSYQFGRGGSTALNWVETNDPRPDYYRNLPSYFESIGETDRAAYVANQWMNNENARQLNWDHMYFANSKWLHTVNDVNGVEGNDVQGMRSKFIIEDRRHDKADWGINSNISHEVTDKIKFVGGMNLNFHKGYHFNVVEDLLGGDYWLDIDKYANGEAFEVSDEQQSDLLNPNRLVKEGDRYSHDYTSTVNYYGLWGQSVFTYRKVDFYFGVNVSHTEFWRTGNMKNGKFPESSYGDSEKERFTNASGKAGITYKINGMNFITANVAMLSKAPNFRNSFISVRTRNQAVDNLKSEKILSGDINYILRHSFAKARLTFYYTSMQDQTWSRSFYHEDLNTFVNYNMTGVDKLHAGFELGIEANVTSELTITGVLGKGEFIYNSRPTATISADNTAEVIENRVPYIKNYYIGGMPQTIGSIGLKYFSSKYWWAGIQMNYFEDLYLQLNPDRRTAEAVDGFYEGDYRIEEVIQQTKMPSTVTVDVWAGKSFRIDDYILGINLSVSNLTNVKNYAMSGYEQFRYDPIDMDKFPPKTYYMYGLTYFVNVNFRF